MSGAWMHSLSWAVRYMDRRKVLFLEGGRGRFPPSLLSDLLHWDGGLLEHQHFRTYCIGNMSGFWDSFCLLFVAAASILTPPNDES